MDNILPNFGLLKSVNNWFLVAFVMAILVFTFGLINKDK